MIAADFWGRWKIPDTVKRFIGAGGDATAWMFEADAELGIFRDANGSKVSALWGAEDESLITGGVVRGKEAGALAEET